MLNRKHCKHVCYSVFDYQSIQFSFAVLSVLLKAHQSCDSSALTCLPAGHLVSRSVDKVTLHLEKFPLDELCDVVGFFDHVNELKCHEMKDPQQVRTGQCLYDNFSCHSLIIDY